MTTYQITTPEDLLKNLDQILTERKYEMYQLEKERNEMENRLNRI